MTETKVAPKLTVVRDYDAMSSLAADAVERLVTNKPEAVFSLPTGTTPLGLFNELLERVRAGTIDFSRAHLFCLDEYVGVNREDPNSLTGFLDRSFLYGAGFDPERVHMATRSRKGYWRMSQNEIVRHALNNRWLEEQGVPDVRAIWIALHYGKDARV